MQFYSFHFIFRILARQHTIHDWSSCPAQTKHVLRRARKRRNFLLNRWLQRVAFVAQLSFFACAAVVMHCTISGGRDVVFHERRKTAVSIRAALPPMQSRLFPWPRSMQYYNCTCLSVVLLQQYLFSDNRPVATISEKLADLWKKYQLRRVWSQYSAGLSGVLCLMKQRTQDCNWNTAGVREII